MTNPSTASVLPNAYSQYASAFNRGNDTSGAPICNGTVEVREREQDRRREEQQHDRAVHREQLVVLLDGEDQYWRPTRPA